MVLSDTPEGFIVFWHLIFPEPMPMHVVAWAKEYYEALAHGQSLAIEAFRGSLKTTTFTIGLSIYRLGLQPDLEIIVAQEGDTTAHENTEYMASIIKDSPGFRFVFPHVKPDMSKGWGAHGYELMRDDMPYGAWRKLRTKVPSIVGAGYESAEILGKHPRLHGITDDVCSHRNTRSPRELNHVVSTVEKEVKIAFDNVQMQIDVFTPWTRDDVGARVKGRPGVRHIRTPIYKLGPDGRPGSEPVWPEKFPAQRIEQLRAGMAPSDFAQAYLCDLEAASGTHLKKEWLWRYPHEEIKRDWPIVLGNDYASVGKSAEIRDRDYFALAAIRLHPRGFAIIEGGYFGHLLPADCEDMAINWGEKYGHSMRGLAIEALGKGEGFYARMLSLAPFRVKGFTAGNKKKAVRIEKELAPMFRAGRVRISDAPDEPFLEEFEKEWLSFDGMDTYFDDCLDAAYYGLLMIKPNISVEDRPKTKKKWSGKNPLFEAFGMRS